MGVVFTVLFAIGLIFIGRAARQVDLDPGCVLYGSIETVALDTTSFFGFVVPRAAIVIGGVLLANLLAVVLLYKELKISTFDPALATTMGINARLMHYLLMTLVAITTVASFESVGSVLVIAMLIVPAAAAHLLTDRLSLTLVIAALIAMGSAFFGHVAAISAPAWFGFEGVSTTTAGMMAVVAGLAFLLALIAGPRYGVVSKVAHRARLSLRILRDDVLGLLYRLEEFGAATAPDVPRLLRQAVGASPLLSRLAILELRRRGLITAGGVGLQLTDRGRLSARKLVRSHGRWDGAGRKGLPSAVGYHAGIHRATLAPPAEARRARRRSPRASVPAFSASAQDVLDLAVEVGEVEGCVQEGVRSVERRRHLVEPLADAGEHDDAGVAQRVVLPDRAADLPAAHPRHHHVEDDEVRLLPAGRPERFFPVRRFDQSDLLLAQVPGDQAEHLDVVVRDQDGRLFRFPAGHRVLSAFFRAREHTLGRRPSNTPLTPRRRRRRPPGASRSRPPPGRG